MKKTLLLLLSLCLIAFSCHMPIPEPTLSELPLNPVAYEHYDFSYWADTVHYSPDNTPTGVKIFIMDDTLVVDVCFWDKMEATDIDMSAANKGDTLVLNLNGNFNKIVCADSHYLFRYKFTDFISQNFYYRVWFNNSENKFEGYSSDAFVFE